MLYFLMQFLEQYPLCKSEYHRCMNTKKKHYQFYIEKQENEKFYTDLEREINFECFQIDAKRIVHCFNVFIF